MRIIALLFALALSLILATSAQASPDRDFSDGPPGPSLDNRSER